MIGDAVHISPGAHFAGCVKVGGYAWLGIGSVFINGIKIGEEAVIAAGVSVIIDVVDGCTVAVVPAIEIKKG